LQGTSGAIAEGEGPVGQVVRSKQRIQKLLGKKHPNARVSRCRTMKHVQLVCVA